MVLFSLQGGKKVSWGGKKRGKDEGMTGFLCVESKEGTGRRKGWVRGVTRRGKEGRMKGPSGTIRRIVSQLSLSDT